MIKPHIPTPETLKNYKISFLDKFMPQINFAVILFYQSKLQGDTNELEESLSKILVQFYPLAGRYMKHALAIDCSDEGVEFVVAEAQDDVVLMDVVAKANAEQLKHLFPDQYFRACEDPHDPLLSIQATHFPCGGLTIAISVFHRIFDAASLGTFIAAWSIATNPNSNKTITITPTFDLHLLLPYNDHYSGKIPDRASSCASEFVMRRLVFDKDALMRLRSRLRPNMNGKIISGVRIVCAVIAKSLIKVYRAQQVQTDINFFITQLINMRERTILPQPKHACGNLVIPTVTRCVPAVEAEVIGMEELVDVIGDSIRKSIVECAQMLSPNIDACDVFINIITSLKIQVLKPHTNFIVFSDWSTCGFYDADFGFGKPVWVGTGPQRPDGNTTVLMSNKEGDGIEAWVHLRTNDMRYFDEDEEIKLFLN